MSDFFLLAIEAEGNNVKAISIFNKGENTDVRWTLKPTSFPRIDTRDSLVVSVDNITLNIIGELNDSIMDKYNSKEFLANNNFIKSRLRITIVLIEDHFFSYSIPSETNKITFVAPVKLFKDINSASFVTLINTVFHEASHYDDFLNDSFHTDSAYRQEFKASLISYCLTAQFFKGLTIDLEKESQNQKNTLESLVDESVGITSKKAEIDVLMFIMDQLNASSFKSDDPNQYKILEGLCQNLIDTKF
tara:strand:- start:1131 stop:1871 length:741 start_codon:yes stop_codon:yes gene_type:complete